MKPVDCSSTLEYVPELDEILKHVIPQNKMEENIKDENDETNLSNKLRSSFNQMFKKS